MSTVCESKYINRSLCFLEQVTLALTEKKKREHIPYRQCKLAHILKDSLGGNCTTVMIANLWVEPEQIEETVMIYAVLFTLWLSVWWKRLSSFLPEMNAKINNFEGKISLVLWCSYQLSSLLLGWWGFPISLSRMYCMIHRYCMWSDVGSELVVCYVCGMYVEADKRVWGRDKSSTHGTGDAWYAGETNSYCIVLYK